MRTRVAASLAISVAVVVGAWGAVMAVAEASTGEATVTPACAAPSHPGQMTCFALRKTQPRVAAGSMVIPPGYGPTDLQSAYKLNPAGGGGTSVAIVDAFDNPNAEQDLATYRSQYGLPACTTANGCFRKVNQNGATSPLPAFDAGWASEISLDLDMVSAICPNCHILLVEANSSFDSDLLPADDQAVAQGAKYVSNSWGGNEVPSQTSTLDPHFNKPGVAFTASTGDNGAGTFYPATSRYVTAVGGTSLTPAGNSRGWAETAWSGAGSGCSAYDAKPSWQTVSTGCPRRADADVSAVADPNTGVAVYDGGWQVYGGTSVSSPIIASVYALAGTPGASDFPAAYPYHDQGDLFDVTSGSNGVCGAPLCSAGVGWDGPTGLGTPNGTAAFTAPPQTTVQAGNLFPVKPYRILDTRSSHQTLGQGQTLRLNVGGGGIAQNQFPSSGMAAVVLNVTVTNATSSSFLTLWPDGGSRPTASNLNFTPGWTGANSVTVPVSAANVVDIYNAFGSVDVIVDAGGFYPSVDSSDTPPGAGGAYHPHTPVRAADTRFAGTGQVPSNWYVAVPFDYGSTINPHVKAVAVNITAVNPHTSGFLTAWSGSGTPLTTSVLNFTANAVVPNLAIVPVSTCTDPACNGLPQIGVLNGSGAGVDVVVDVFGYYDDGTPTDGLRYHPLTPTRIVDSRQGQGIPHSLGTGATATVTVSNTIAGANTRARVLNVTGVQPTTPTFLTVWPTGVSRPNTSTLNLNAGDVRPNAAIAGLNSLDQFNVYNASGTVNVVVDVSGTFDVVDPGQPAGTAPGPNTGVIKLHPVS